MAENVELELESDQNNSMKFTHSYYRPSLNLDGYKKALDKQMKEALAQGLMEWLSAMLIEVPLWSGASRATFVKLAQHIDVQVPVSGGPAPFDRTGEGMTASKGEFVAEIESGQYYFTYGTSLPWLIWNEYHNANVDPDPTLFYRLKKPGPYEFQTKGATVFLHMMRLVDLPRVAPYIQGMPVR